LFGQLENKRALPSGKALLFINRKRKIKAMVME
jgi:hypothetical protein